MDTIVEGEFSRHNNRLMNRDFDAYVPCRGQMHARADGMVNEYWMRLLARECAEIAIFLYIGLVPTSMIYGFLIGTI